MVAAGKPVHASEIGWYWTVVSRLYGYRLTIMRGAWVVIAFVALVVFMAGLSVSFSEALRISDATRLGLAQVGLSARFPAFFYLTSDILTFVSFGGLALLLAWRRSDDWAVLFIALMLLLTGLLRTDPPANSPRCAGTGTEATAGGDNEGGVMVVPGTGHTTT